MVIELFHFLIISKNFADLFFLTASYSSPPSWGTWDLSTKQHCRDTVDIHSRCWRNTNHPYNTDSSRCWQTRPCFSESSQDDNCFFLDPPCRSEIRRRISCNRIHRSPVSTGSLEIFLTKQNHDLKTKLTLSTITGSTFCIWSFAVGTQTKARSSPCSDSRAACSCARAPRTPGTPAI